MDDHIKQRIREIGGEAILFDVPAREYTTFRTGGNVEAMYRAGNLQGLKHMVAFLADEGIPYLVMGSGSNLLVRDGGFDGVAIILDGSLASVEDCTVAEPSILVGAGLKVHRLVEYCAEKGLAGVEFMAGIPGTLGGAVAMNAGSWGKEIGEVISEVAVLTAGGIVETRDRLSLAFTYRELDLPPGAIILNAKLGLRFDKPAVIKKRVASYLKQRKERFPLDMPSAGSIFKNPEGGYAGRLIDAAGLKEKAIGGAMISPKHANFILNTGKSSASDIVALMDLATVKVKEVFNIQLIPEIKVVGKE
ncbi:MAG: UDP-N-acetylmuramate dehydrogenase [Desulfobacteraceae bacterium]|nr:MAG: UDP-N-acetylmuramate dehydrogenase [Desulfobacteraceae bacterium]